MDVLPSQLGKPTTRIVCVAIGALRNSLPACDFSLQTFGHRARFYPASVAFRNSLVGKPTKTFFFLLVQLVEARIPALLERDQAESAAIFADRSFGCGRKVETALVLFILATY